MTQYHVPAQAVGFENIEYVHNTDWSGEARIEWKDAQGEHRVVVPGPVLKAILWEAEREQADVRIEKLEQRLTMLERRIDIVPGRGSP